MKVNFRALGKALVKSSKRIGPAVAVALGSVLTAYGAYKVGEAMPTAKQHIADKKAELGREKLTIKETYQACAKDLAKPVVTTAAGIASVAGGVFGYETTVGNLTKAVGVATAVISEQESAISQVVGPEKAQEIQQTALKNVVEPANPKTTDISHIGIAMTQYPDELFLEPFSGRWLMASEKWLTTCELAVYKKAVRSAFSDPIMLNDLYNSWTSGGSGATESVYGDYLGWPISNVDECNPIDISFTPKRMSDGRLYKEIAYSTPAKFIGC